MSLIQHKNVLEIHLLSTFALSMGDEVNYSGEWSSAEEKADAYDTLVSLVAFLAECGQHVELGDKETLGNRVSVALMCLNGLSGGRLIEESYFAQSLKEEIESLPYHEDTLREYVVIDWSATIANFKMDYTLVTLDDWHYFIRLN